MILTILLMCLALVGKYVAFLFSKVAGRVSDAFTSFSFALIAQ